MITSNEINALIAMQNQQLAAGRGVYPMGMPAPTPGASQYPPQFSFGLNQQGGGFGAQTAAAGMAGMGGIPMAMSGMAMGAGLAQTVGDVGGMMGGGAWASRLSGSRMLGGMARMDPISAFAMGALPAGGAALAGGGGIGGMLGAGAMGGVAGMMNPITMGAMAVGFGINQGMQGFREQQQVGAAMGGAQFANAGAATGRGWSSQQMQQVGGMMRRMDVADPFVQMRDLNQMMSRFNEFQMGAGTNDAEEFSKRFSKMVETVKSMAKTLGTTMDEAAQTFGQMRQAGFYTPQDVLGASGRMRTLGGMGMTRDTFMAASQQGAQITRAAGMRGRAGAGAATNTAEMLLTGAQSGMFSAEEMMDITGAGTGAEAAAQIGLNVTQSMTRYLTESAAGRATLAALGEQDKGGRFTGKVRGDRLEGLRTGRMGVDELRKTAGGNLGGNRAAQLSFVEQSQEIASNLLAQQDPAEVAQGLIKSIAGEKYGDMNQEDLASFLTQHMTGLGRREAQMLVKLAEEGGRLRRDRNKRMMQELQQEAYETDTKMNRSFSGLMTKVQGTFQDVIAAPVKSASAEVGAAFEQSAQRMSDVAWGRTRFQATEASQTAALMRMAGAAPSAVPVRPQFTAKQEEMIQQRTEAARKNEALQQFVRTGAGDLSQGEIMGEVITGGRGGGGGAASQAAARAGFERAFGGQAEAATAEVLRRAGMGAIAQPFEDMMGGDPRAKMERMRGELLQGLVGSGDVGGGGGGAGVAVSLISSLMGKGMGEGKYADILEGGGALSLMAALGGEKDIEKTMSDIEGGVKSDVVVGRAADIARQKAEAYSKRFKVKITGEEVQRVEKLLLGKSAEEKTSLLKKAMQYQEGMQLTADFTGLSSLLASQGIKDIGGGLLGMGGPLRELRDAARSGNVDAVAGAADEYLGQISGSESAMAKLEEAGAAGVVGAGGILQAAQLYKRGAKSIKEVTEATGLTEEALGKMGISAEGGISEAESKKAARMVLYQQGQGGGGVFTSGSEQAMTAHLNAFAQQTITMAEHVQSVGELVKELQAGGGASGKSTVVNKVDPSWTEPP